MKRQTLFERMYWLLVHIIRGAIVGFVKTTYCRMRRGARYHPGWSLPRELTLGIIRQVVLTTQDVFSEDPTSYVAWTKLVELATKIPTCLRARAQGTRSYHVQVQGIPCVVLCKQEDYADVVNALEGASYNESGLLWVVHFHGGGYVSGGLNSAMQVGLDLISQTHHLDVDKRLVVIHVDYALGPHQKYPQAVVDGVTVYDWLTTKLGVPTSKVFFMGESAGGGLVCAVLLALRDNPPFLRNDKSYAPPAGAIVLSPMLDVTHNTDYDSHLESHDIIQGKLARGCARTYVENPQDAHSPYASPYHAVALHDLPPVLIQTGKVEIFDPVCRSFAEKGRSHGSMIQYESYEGMTHCFHMFLHSGCIQSKQAFASIFSFLKVNS